MFLHRDTSGSHLGKLPPPNRNKPRAQPAVPFALTELNFRFGSEADICGATAHVRFTPDSDRESGHAAMVMSALHLKADMCGANRHVCFGPEADIVSYSITSSA